MQLFPAGDRLVRNIVDHPTRKRTIILVDSDLRSRSTLHEGLFDWDQIGGPSEFNFLTHRIEVSSGDGKIYVSDTETGFFIRVLDLDGRTITTIDRTSAEEALPV